jgi:GTP-binding protein
MDIIHADFLTSQTDPTKLPVADKPEYAFIGRSNVGKSSLLNMLTGRKGLAKTSSTPGKTQVINHFLINHNWYLVDLPGYGFAKTSRTNRETWDIMIRTYLATRPNLMCVFQLIDSRLEPQRNDLDFLTWLGEQQIPIALIFTKADKQSPNKTQSLIAAYKRVLRTEWASLPPIFVTSAESKVGRPELLKFITEVNAKWGESQKVEPVVVPIDPNEIIPDESEW